MRSVRLANTAVPTEKSPGILLAFASMLAAVRYSRFCDTSADRTSATARPWTHGRRASSQSKTAPEPPNTPAMAPRQPPTRNPTATATTPAMRLTRAPNSMRLNTSRPWRSVPIRCSALGSCSLSARRPASGSYGAIRSAKTPSMTSDTIKNRPTIAGGLRRRRPHASRKRPRLRRAGPIRAPLTVVASITNTGCADRGPHRGCRR